MKELRSTNLYRLIKNEISVRIEDIRTMEVRIVDCDGCLSRLLDMGSDELNDYALELFNN